METREDCFNWLDFDVIMVILMCLGDPADFIRVSSLSRFWYNFAFFQPGDPIYAAKSVRFRVGHPKSPSPLDILLQKAIQRNIQTDTSEGFSMAQPVDILHQEAPEDGFIWTWTSQEFPMAQENRLQKFKLPKPVLCFGGIVQIELLGRVQRQEMDGLFYICVSHVEVIGGRLFPGFDIEILEPSGKIVLKYFPNLSPIRIRHHRAQPVLIPRLPLLRGGLMQGPLRAFGRMPHLFQRIRQQDESDDPGSQQHEPEPT